jgi:hypothetical protein
MEIIYIDLMKRSRKILIIFLVYFFSGCVSTPKTVFSKNTFEGEYILKSDKLFQALSDMNYHSLNLKPDGTYILRKAEIKFTPVIEQCEIASKGKWTILSNDVIELTSEDKYFNQIGFKYELKTENKFSQDSLYIKVNFSNDVDQLPIKLNFSFNNNNSKSLETEARLVVLPKAKYLRTISKENHIEFYLTGNLSCKSRSVFQIFEEDIDTETTNYLTITLPNFDRCFYEFEPFNKDLIYIKSSNQLFWQGEYWESVK